MRRGLISFGKSQPWAEDNTELQLTVIKPAKDKVKMVAPIGFPVNAGRGLHVVGRAGWRNGGRKLRGKEGGKKKTCGLQESITTSTAGMEGERTERKRDGSTDRERRGLR